MGFRVWGLGLRVQDIEFRVWVLGFRVWGLGFRLNRYLREPRHPKKTFPAPQDPQTAPSIP